MDVDKFNKEIGELKHALEYEIDVVLTIEQDRLLVVKENKIQKDKIRELNQLLEKYTGFQQLIQIEKCVQTESITQLNQATQIDQDNDNEDSLSQCTSMSLSQTNMSNDKSRQSIGDLQNSLDSELVTEAKTLLNNASKKYITRPTSSKMAQRGLKFGVDSQKENKIPVTKPPQQDQKEMQLESMAQELLRVTKQIQQLKLQQRASLETIKKQEKDHHDQQRTLDVKNEMLDKLREESANMALIINEAKFKSIRSLDNEHKKVTEQLKALQKQNEQKTYENGQLTKELNQFRVVLEKLTDQFEKIKSNDPDRTSRSHDQKTEQNLHILEGELRIKNQSIQELMSVNEKMNQEVDYFRQISFKQKERFEQQEQDLEFYRGLLIKNNIIK